MGEENARNGQTRKVEKDAADEAGAALRESSIGPGVLQKPNAKPFGYLASFLREASTGQGWQRDPNVNPFGLLGSAAGEDEAETMEEVEPGADLVVEDEQAAASRKDARHAQDKARAKS